MKVKATCLMCGYIVEADLEIEVDTNRFAEACRFLQQQAKEHQHPEDIESCEWRLWYEGMTT